MAAGEYLEWYADRFPIVEVDSTFYRVPSKAMVQGWRNRTPDGFRFVLKVPQVITHQKQLRDCEEEVDGFVTVDPAAGREADRRRSSNSATSTGGRSPRSTTSSTSSTRSSPAGRTSRSRWRSRSATPGGSARSWSRSSATTTPRSTLTEQTWMPRPAEVAAAGRPGDRAVRRSSGSWATARRSRRSRRPGTRSSSTGRPTSPRPPA